MLIKNIMKEVLTNYTTRLEKELGNVEIYSSNAKNRLLIDFQYYIQKLSLLDGVDGPGNRLEVVVNNITIKEKKPTLEQKTIINEYIRQSFDSGSRRSSIYDENSSSYTNSPLIMGKNDDSIIGSERLSNSPLIIGGNAVEGSERLSMDNLNQDELNLDSNNEIINIQHTDNLGVGGNEYTSSSLNQSISFNNDDEPSIHSQYDNNSVTDNVYQQNINNYNNNVNNNNIPNTLNVNIINNNNNNDQDRVVSALNSVGLGNNESSYFDKRHNSAPDNSYSYNPNVDNLGSSIYDRKNSYSEEKNSKSSERKNSYTINKKTFSVFSQNVKKFGSEIKRHYHSNNNSMESLFGLDKMTSKSNSSKSLPSNPDMFDNEQQYN